jgi:enoyl-CoA hydratase/carnithine racemase
MPILLREDDGPICHLTLNNPETLNSLSDAMLAELDAVFDALEGDSSIRVVILKGAGNVFCAGHDLKEMTRGRQAEDAGAAYFADLFKRCGDLMQRINRLPQPVIAQVHGIATAAGCQLVASCDLAIAAYETRFGVNGVNIGLFCSTPMVALSRAVSRKQAFEMLVTGDFITADHAVELGLINRSVDPDGLAEETIALAQQIAGQLGTAVKIGKQAFYEQLQMPLDQAYAHTTKVMAENMLDLQTEKGIATFLNKQKPTWDQ